MVQVKYKSVRSTAAVQAAGLSLEFLCHRVSNTQSYLTRFCSDAVKKVRIRPSSTTAIYASASRGLSFGLGELCLVEGFSKMGWSDLGGAYRCYGIDDVSQRGLTGDGDFLNDMDEFRTQEVEVFAVAAGMAM